MKELTYGEVVENKLVADEIYELYIHSPKEVVRARPGQFLSIFTGNPSMILPRPLSICEIDKEEGTFRIIYRAGGEGTKEIATYSKGDKLGVLGPLGISFRVDQKNKNYAIVGGGIGVPPLLELSKKIREEVPDSKIYVYLGFRGQPQVILEEDFKKYVDEVTICTDDGTYGFHGNVIAAMKNLNKQLDIAYACGPHIMLKFLAKYCEEIDIQCTVSVEEHMACCVGACLACVIKQKTNDGDWAYRRVCMNGPVFNAKELVWE